MKILRLSIILAAACSGCGPADVRFQDYHVSLVQSYQGSKAVSNATCFQEARRSSSDPVYTFFYQRIAYASGDAFVSCAVADTTKVSGTKNYFALETGVSDGSCTAAHPTAGSWIYTRAGSATSANVTSADPALNGWSLTLSDCADQN